MIGNRLNIKKRGWTVYEICYSDYVVTTRWCDNNATGDWKVSRTSVKNPYVAFQNEGDALVYKLAHPI
jgi:hypothetical protein